MKKYLFVIPSLSKGGAERVVSILANELVNQNREAVIVTHFIANTEYPLSSNVKVLCISNKNEKDYRSQMSIFYLIYLAKRLRNIIIKEKPDYILPFLWTTCVRTDIALKGTKYKNRVIQTVRNNPYIFPRNIIMKKYRNHLVKKSTLTIVQNQEQKNYFSQKVRKTIEILPNPVSKELFSIERNEDKDFFRIIGVGRLERQKNFEILIVAVSDVYKKYPNIKLDIFGDGSLIDILQEKINKLGMNSIITLRGYSDNYSEIFSNASVYVLSSSFEGMPNTLLEAMAVGIPSISTDCKTGPSDIIDNYVNGILIKTNDVDELSKSITRLIVDKELKRKLGENAKKDIFKMYSQEKIVVKLKNFCEESILEDIK